MLNAAPSTSSFSISDAGSNEMVEGLDNAYALAFINRRPDDVAVATLAPVDTNINFPPITAWNYDNSDYESFFKMGPETLYRSSIDMGHSFLNEGPTADFVGSGPTIKRLLLEPYSAGPMSLICHRIGKTIYLDQENFSKKELQNLDVVPSSCWEREDNSHSSYFHGYPSLSMYENLIWHSKEITDEWPDEYGKGRTGQELALREYGPGTRVSSHEFPRMFQSYSYKIKPQDNLDGEAYLWEFHDMRMLVDVDLPIFGGGQFPSVSIRLSEEEKPISVLTGIDIMLDQLMCHIPETIMVYHQKGVIKEYDIVVKEEIPYLKGSEFDPSKLKVITENMLSFLTKNMTQQGHTYWLFREKGSDEMKLYDLTGLCPGLAKNPQWNPFLVPVIMLLYKLAYKLMSETQQYRSEKVTNVAYGLLNAADTLLKDEGLSAHRACVQYLLSGLYLTFGSTSTRESEDNSQDHLLNGLDDLITDGYARLSSTIKLSQLKKQHVGSECESSDSSMKQQLPGPTKIPNSGPLSDCCEQTLEHCLQALSALESSRNDEPEVDIPFVADGLDDMAALKSIKHATNDTIFTLLRHCLLTRALTAYSSLVNQNICVDRHDKVFNFAKMGIMCCASILSSQPAARHLAICQAFLPLMTSSLIHAMTKLADAVTDVSVLKSMSYRDQQIMKHLTENVNIKEQYNFAKYWKFETDSVTWNDWMEKIQGLIDRCVMMIETSPNAYNKIQFPPTKEACVTLEQVGCRVAMIAMQLGSKSSESARSIMGGQSQEEEYKEERFQSAMSHVNVSKQLFQKGIDILESIGGRAVRECHALVQVNSVIAWKLEYKLLSMKPENQASNLIGIIEHICSTYRAVFSLLQKDITTLDGNSVYINSLLEYANTLIMFTRDIVAETAPQFVVMRTNFLLAAQRALESLRNVNGTHHQQIRSEAAALSTYVYFQLLSLKQAEMETFKEWTSSVKFKSMMKEFLDILKSASEHLCRLGDLTLDPPARRAPPEYIRFTMFALNSPLVNDLQRSELCRMAMRWNLVVIKSGLEETSPWIDDNRIDTMWKDMQNLLKWMNKTWPKVDRLKKAYMCLLSRLPEDHHERMTLVYEKLIDSLTLLTERECKAIEPAKAKEITNIELLSSN